MRRLLIAGWLLLPVGAWAYHEGPGQDGLQLDGVDAELAKAKKARSAGDWAEAIKAYEAALKELPGQTSPELARAARRIELSIAKAKLESSRLIEARKELRSLVDELTEDGNSDDLLAEAREAYANSQYYYTWLMRLEGYPRTDWEPEIEIARQAFRLLAEQADERGDGARSVEHMEDLESAIQLARMDLEELQGLPLPSQ